MKQPNAYKLSFRLFARNWKSVLAFEALYKLATACVVTPVLYGLLQASIRLAGLTYLSNDTLRAYLLSPATIVFLLVLLLLAAFVCLVEIEALICCYHASYYDESMSVSQMFSAGLSKARRVFHRRNWLAVIFVLLILPLTNAAAASGYVSSIEIPEFVRDVILANTTLHLLYRIVGLALVLLAFVWTLSLQAFTLENLNFLKAGKESAGLMKGRYVRTLLGMLLWQFLLLLLGAAVWVAVTGLAFWGIWLFCAAYMRYAAAMAAMLVTLTGMAVLTSILSVPFVFANLSTRYYLYKTETGQEIPPQEACRAARMRPTVGKALAAVLCLAVAVNAVMLFTQADDGDQSMWRLLGRPEIAAHRGSSVLSPENSIPAFERAMQEGADWIELDVHQTRDGVVVVSHDESIKRIAGVDKKVWALTYDELAQYDVGSWFSPAFSDLRIAKLDEVLKLCKGKIKLNIELKPTGHEPGFEQNVIDLLRQNGYEKGEYILASQNADALQTVKKIDADIETLFVMAVAAGNVLDIPFADRFSVEESSIDEKLVNRIHAAGKQIYAWTVNREENMEKMLNLRVDCIISDDPLMVQATMNAERLPDLLERLAALFFAPDTEPVRPELAESQ